jgi:flagellin-like hook-associated protein FlgL
MVTRISTAVSNQVLVNRMLEQQQRVNDDQMQLSTGFKSQDYIGIAQDSFRLLNIENERARLSRYVANNDLLSTTLKAQATSVTGIDDTARMIRSELLQFTSRDLTSQNPENLSAVADLQQKVFSAFSQVQYFLTQKIDGKYIFGGAKSDTPPISFDYKSLNEFQQFYDGINAVFPSTRVANLVDLSIPNVDVTYSNVTVGTNPMTLVTGAAGDFVTDTIDQVATGNLLFSNVGSNGKITATTPGSFRSLQVGQTFIADGTTLGNKGVFTITGVSPDGNTITLDQNVTAGAETGGTVELKLTIPNGTAMALSGSAAGNNGAYTVRWPSNAELAAAGFDPNGGLVTPGDMIFLDNQIPITGAPETISLDSRAFLTGTSLSTEHRLSDTQVIELDVTGLDPAFEKLTRALGIIAQGDLINNPDRVQQALGIINDAIEHSPLQPTEEKSDLQGVQDRIGINQRALQDAKEIQTSFLAFLEGRQNELEKADTTEVAVRLQTDSQILQISYASLAKMSELTLLNYLR